MLSEPRTISILAELVHIPAKHSFERLREVYNQVSSACGYDNCIRLSSGARLENGQREQGDVSTITFTNERVQMVEDCALLSVEETGKKLMEVLRCAMPTLGIQLILAQQYTIRAAVTPNSFKSAAEFIGRSLFRIREEDVAVLNRPTQIFGLRLVFPATVSQLHQFNVRIESYSKDPQSVFLENVGVFKMPPLQQQQLGALQENMEKTSEFLGGNICKFLSQYDRRAEAL